MREGLEVRGGRPSGGTAARGCQPTQCSWLNRGFFSRIEIQVVMFALLCQLRECSRNYSTSVTEVCFVLFYILHSTAV